MAAYLGRRQCLPAAIVFGVRAGYTGRPDRPRERRGRWIPLFGASFAAERRNPCGSPRLFHVKRSYPGPKFGRPNFVPGSTGSHRPSRAIGCSTPKRTQSLHPSLQGRNAISGLHTMLATIARLCGGVGTAEMLMVGPSGSRETSTVSTGWWIAVPCVPASERQSGRWPGIHANGRGALGPPCLPSDCYRGCSSVCSRLPVVQRSGGQDSQPCGHLDVRDCCRKSFGYGTP